MRRQEFPASVRRAAWDRCNGFCESCGYDLAGLTPEYDHGVPDAMGGKPTLDNCVVLCKACHRAKTGKTDAPRIAKTHRQANKTAGIETRRKQKIGDPRFKRKVDGRTVRRDDD